METTKPAISLVAYPCHKDDDEQFPVLLAYEIIDDRRSRPESTALTASLPSYLGIDGLNKLLKALPAPFEAAYLSADQALRFKARVTTDASLKANGHLRLGLVFVGDPPEQLIF
jgi:hypothetical protein